MPGSHHAFFLDVLQRQHAVVEDRVRTEKATGMRNLPFTSYARDQAWLLAANIASDLLAYLQLLGLDQDEELAAAEPETLRATILHIPARLTAHARRRVLKIERSWPWAEAVVAAWEFLDDSVPLHSPVPILIATTLVPLDLGRCARCRTSMRAAPCLGDGAAKIRTGSREGSMPPTRGSESLVRLSRSQVRPDRVLRD